MIQCYIEWVIVMQVNHCMNQPVSDQLTKWVKWVHFLSETELLWMCKFVNKLLNAWTNQMIQCVYIEYVNC